MATSRAVLRQDAAKLLGLLLWSGTASGGSTTTLIDTGDGGLRDTGLSTFLFSGAYVLATSGGDSGAWRQVPRTGFTPSSGTVTFGEAMTTGFSNGVTYDIYLGLDPDQWNVVVNDALARLRYEYMNCLTLITDGDMETSGVGSWTASNTALTKLTSGAFVEGAQALRAANSGAAGYAQSGNVPCQPGNSFTAWAT